MSLHRLFASLAWSGVRLELEPDGRIHVVGTLTDEQRAAVLEHRDAVVARLDLNHGIDSGHSLGRAVPL